MKKHLLSLFLLVTLSPIGYSQDEGSYIELSKVIQTNGAKSQAKIFIAPKSDINSKLRNEFSAAESIIIDALIKPASDDISKQIDIFVVIRKQVGSKKTFYALDEDGVWVSWNGSLKSLPIYEIIESASDKHEFRVYDGAIASDEFNLYLGYSSETVNEKPVIHVNLTPYKIKAFENSISKAKNDIGNRVFLSKDESRLIDAALFQNYSTEKHEGFIYHSSAGGETVEFPGSWFGDGMNMCRTGNFNSDQYEDIVVSSNNKFDLGNLKNESDGINQEKLPRTHIFLNDGKGSYISGSNLFDGAAHYRMRSYGQPQVADLNNDGIDDILSQNGGGGLGYDLVTDHGIGLFLSNPDGTFFDATDRLDIEKNEIQREDYSESVLQILTESFIALDVDLDGWKDLLFVSGSKLGSILPFVLFNDHAERFVPYEIWQPNLAKSNYEPGYSIVRHTEVVDFDNDGDDDIVALCYRECLSGEYSGYNGYILVNEDGVFDIKKRIVFPDGLRGENTKNDHMAVGDINGDGFMDIVTVSGASDPYYVDRDIQILINDGGEALVDETDLRIANLNDPDTGHAEGAIYLVDYDQDGDLDIIDWQANVREGKAFDTASPGSDFPYGMNGLAIFLNDGAGNFVYEPENLIYNPELKEVDGSIKEDWFNKELNSVQGVCPIFFNSSYGYGFLYSHFYYDKDPDKCPDGECDTSTYSTVRRN
jgi:hypothetical protein